MSEVFLRPPAAPPRPWRCLRLLCLGLSMLLAGCGALLEDRLIDTEKAWPLREAQTWLSADADWAPPPTLGEAGDGVLDAATPWQTVALPHQVPLRSDMPPPTGRPDVRWYRLPVPENMTQTLGERPGLYLPRWNVRGTVGVYADGRLLWHTAGGRQVNGFYTPLWIDVEWPASTTHEIHVRIAALPGHGSTLSALWLGPPQNLALAWHARHLLQAGLISGTRAAYWIVGVFVLIGWYLQRPRPGRTQLWFAALAFSAPVPFMVYLMDDRSLWLPEIFLVWGLFAGTLAMLVFLLLFLTHFLRFSMPRLLAAHIAYCVLAGLAMSGYVAAFGADMPPQILVRRLEYLLMPPALTFLWFSLYAAWRQRSRMTLLFASVAVFQVPAVIHDVIVQAHWGGADHVLLSPYGFPMSLLVYLYAVLRHYLSAIEQARHTRLSQELALQAQGAQLAESHARLMQAQQAQILVQERQRMMREMHDGIGASLLSTLHYLRHGKATTSQAAQVIEECIDDLKLSIDSLEPAYGDLLQLLASLRYRLEPRLQQSGIAFHWQVADVPPLAWLDAQSGMHVLRIFQEILTNILKHSGADSVTFSTTPETRAGEDGICVEVCDNGRPFTPPVRLQTGRKGLGNVSSRVRLLGAHGEWQALPDGNRFSLWLPLADKREKLA